MVKSVFVRPGKEATLDGIIYSAPGSQASGINSRVSLSDLYGALKSLDIAHQENLQTYLTLVLLHDTEFVSCRLCYDRNNPYFKVVDSAGGTEGIVLRAFQRNLTSLGKEGNKVLVIADDRYKNKV